MGGDAVKERFQPFQARCILLPGQIIVALISSWSEDHGRSALRTGLCVEALDAYGAGQQCPTEGQMVSQGKDIAGCLEIRRHRLLIKKTKINEIYVLRSQMVSAG